MDLFSKYQKEFAFVGKRTKKNKNKNEYYWRIWQMGVVAVIFLLLCGIAICTYIYFPDKLEVSITLSCMTGISIVLLIFVFREQVLLRKTAKEICM